MKRKIRDEAERKWQARKLRSAALRGAQRARARHRLPQRAAHLRAADRRGQRAHARRGLDAARRRSCGDGATGNVEAAKKVGAALAALAREHQIEEVVFNRNGFLYHGRVKALADAAREAGLSSSDPATQAENERHAATQRERLRAHRPRGPHQPRGEGREGRPALQLQRAGRGRRRRRRGRRRLRQGGRGARGDPQGHRARAQDADRGPAPGRPHAAARDHRPLRRGARAAAARRRPAPA